MREAIPELAQEIAERLGEIEGVAAVVLGGSWARGEARPDSDVDLGIYYREENRPSVEDLRRLARELGPLDQRRSVRVSRTRPAPFRVVSAA